MPIPPDTACALPVREKEVEPNAAVMLLLLLLLLLLVLLKMEVCCGDWLYKLGVEVG